MFYFTFYPSFVQTSNKTWPKKSNGWWTYRQTSFITILHSIEMTFEIMSDWHFYKSLFYRQITKTGSLIESLRNITHLRTWSSLLQTRFRLPPRRELFPSLSSCSEKKWFKVNRQFNYSSFLKKMILSIELYLCCEMKIFYNNMFMVLS